MLYRFQLEDDIRNYVNENHIDEDALREDQDELDRLIDTLFLEDSVTGNASGSYTFSREKARQNIQEDPDAEEYIRDIISGYGMHAQEIVDHLFDWEYWDVCIRCWLLPDVAYNMYHS